MEKPRDNFLDFLKGVAIILVVFGHSLQYFYSEWEPVYLPIRMFHMPFFMALSAYFIRQSSVKSTLGDYFKKKFIRLGLPVLSWGIISAFLHGGGKLLMHKELDLMQLFVSIFYANWFLSVLLIFSLLAAVIYRYVPKYSNLCWIIVIIILYSIPSFWYLGNCKWLLPFFVIAIQLSSFRWSEIKLSLVIPSIFVFGVCYLLFQNDHSLLSVTNYENNVHYNLNIILRTLAGVSGSFVVVYLSKLMFNWGAINKWVPKIGAISLPLYVVHTQLCDINQVVNIRFGNLYYIIIVSCVLVLISLVVYHLCSHSKWLKMFLFGERY